ncbi:hypothetical protein EMCRGX_G013686 [Ephydatia muelleri]
MWQATVALTFLFTAATGVDPLIPSCLPQKTTVVSVSVEAGGSNYCSNTALHNTQLISQLLDQVQQGPIDERCQLATPRLQECIPVGQGQTNMTITATMTCDSPCVRYNSTLQSLSTLKENLIYLRTASQQQLSVDLNIGGVDIVMWFFVGRQSIVSSCQSNSTSSATKGILLCDCPLQCDKCGDGYYLPPMSSECQPCPQGTWRRAGLDYSSCVQCPPTTSTSSFGATAPTDCIAPVCSQGKVYSECGPVCPPTCTNPTPPSDCPTDCVPGCFCASNMVDYNGQCVLPSDCTSFTPPPPRPPTIIDTDITSGDIQLTIGYDIRVYQGVNITISCTPLVQEHPEGYIHWYSQLINPRAVIRDEQEVTLPDTSVELVVPSTSIPNFLQESFRCEVCVSSQCWSNNSIISVVTIPPPPPPTLPPPTLPPLSCPPWMIFKECGSACPPSCASTDLVCLSVCVAGCFCPDGLLEGNGTCVRPEDCSQSGSLDQPGTDACQLPQDPGPCRNMVTMFFYNPITFQCDQFEYGGCEGNDNRFISEQTCLDTCYSN